MARVDELHLYWRAILLDWVIDPLVNYRDADQAPEHAGNIADIDRRLDQPPADYHSPIRLVTSCAPGTPTCLAKR